MPIVFMIFYFIKNILKSQEKLTFSAETETSLTGNPETSQCMSYSGR
ncbi:MAG: hypothetical protein ACTSWR_07815 [Candidatus Helarchaeota archaeon]